MSCDMQETIKQAKKGKQQAITQLYNQTKDYAYRVARQYVHEADIADAVQEAYIAVFRNLQTFDENKEFTPWLHTIVKNKCIDLLKRNSKQEFILDEAIVEMSDSVPLPLDLLENEQKRKDIQRVISALSIGQRTAVTLFYLEGMSIGEIANELEITEGTVKKQLYLARQAIQKAVLYEESEHDNKLYGIGAVPLLTKLFKSELELGTYTMPEVMSTQVFTGILGSISTSGAIAAGGVMAMTLGGKVTLAVATTIAVVSTAGAGYLYIDKENTVRQITDTVSSQSVELAELKQLVKQQTEQLAELGGSSSDLGNGGTGLSDPAPGVNGDAPILGQGEDGGEPVWDFGGNGGAGTSTPEAPSSKPSTETPSSKPATPPTKPSGGSNNGGGNSGGGREMTPEEFEKALRDRGINAGGGGTTYVNPDDEGSIQAN